MRSIRQILALCFITLFGLHSPLFPAPGKPIIDAGGVYQATPFQVVEVHSIDDVRAAILAAKYTSRKVTIGGALHSQAGHVVLDDAIHLDMRPYNAITALDLKARTLTVQSGITWEKVMLYLTPHQLAPKIMQDLSVFTVGGSLSSNVIGRNPHNPPMINSILSFTLMDAEGNIHRVSRHENADLFGLVVGGYGLFGVVLEVTLEVVPNDALVMEERRMYLKDYPDYLNKVRANPSVIYHSGSFNLDYTALMTRTYFSLGRSASPTPTPGEESRNSIMMRKPVKPYWIPGNSNNLIGFAIPMNQLIPFMTYAKQAIRESGLPVQSVTTKFAKKDKESVLTFIKDDYIVFGFIFHLTPDLYSKAKDLKRRLTKESERLGGNVYLTFSHEIDRQEMHKLYPKWQYFLKKKREFDPKERFSSHFFSMHS